MGGKETRICTVLSPIFVAVITSPARPRVSSFPRINNSPTNDRVPSHRHDYDATHSFRSRTLSMQESASQRTAELSLDRHSYRDRLTKNIALCYFASSAGIPTRTLKNLKIVLNILKNSEFKLLIILYGIVKEWINCYYSWLDLVMCFKRKTLVSCSRLIKCIVFSVSRGLDTTHGWI